MKVRFLIEDAELILAQFVGPFVMAVGGHVHLPGESIVVWYDNGFARYFRIVGYDCLFKSEGRGRQFTEGHVRSMLEEIEKAQPADSTTNPPVKNAVVVLDTGEEHLLPESQEAS